MTLLAAHTTIRLGGPAEEFAEARTEAELLSLVREAAAGELFVLGGGSNVLIADAGVGGRTVKVLTQGIDRVRRGCREVLRVQAGQSWEALVSEMVDDDLAGIECLAGIPGTVGGTPIQNVGAYGQQVSEVIVAVEAYDRHRCSLVRLPPRECGFGYRTSVFKARPGRFVVISVEIGLERSALSKPIRNRELASRLDVAIGAQVDLEEARSAVLELRGEKGMVVDPGDPDTRSLGSFFTNPSFDPAGMSRLEARAAGVSDEPPPSFEVGPDSGEVRVPAAWMIERAGFSKGFGDHGGIAISSKHVLALVNRGDGSSAEAVALAREIAARVSDVFGVALLPEPTFVGHSWQAG